MYDINKIKEYLKENLSEYRYNHSLLVAKEAKSLAKAYNYDEEKDNGNENDTKIDIVVGDTYTNFRKKLGEKLNDEIIKSCMNKKGKYSMGNIEIVDEINNIKKDDKIINKKKITVKNESLIRLIHQFNNKKEKEDKEINNE